MNISARTCATRTYHRRELYFLVLEIDGKLAYEWQVLPEVAAELARRINAAPATTSEIPAAARAVPFDQIPPDTCNALGDDGQVCRRPTGHPGAHRTATHEWSPTP